jgi:hypothetical protein
MSEEMERRISLRLANHSATDYRWSGRQHFKRHYRAGSSQLAAGRFSKYHQIAMQLFAVRWWLLAVKTLRAS